MTNSFFCAHEVQFIDFERIQEAGKHVVEVLDDGPLAAREAGPEARPG